MSTFLRLITALAWMGSAVCVMAVLPQAPLKWTDRVIPLPKEIKIAESITAPAGQIRLVTAYTNEPTHKTIAGLLGAFAQATGDTAAVTIRLALTSDPESGIPKALRQRLAKAPNSDQAYNIQAEKQAQTDQTVITMTANTGLGLLYAARTLAQLVKAGAKLAPETPVEIPLAAIVDWPDMSERGQWGDRPERYADKLVRWKLNMIETDSSNGAYFDKMGNPTNGLNMALIRRGAELGIKVVPFISHMDGIIPNCPVLQGEEARANPVYKHLMPMLAIQDPAKPFNPRYAGLCMANPVTLDVLTAWFLQMASAIDGYSHDVMIWVSEMGSPACFCKECQAANPYEHEVKVFLKAFARAKEKYTGLRLRILTSQDSYPVNDKIIALLPPDVGLTYYDGGRTYATDHKPMIYPLLEKYARSGRWLGVYPQVTPCWYTAFPWTAPQFIQFRAQEFVDKKLSSVSAYAVPDANYYEFNMAALAEWTWNGHGRTPEDFARAYANVTDQKNSADFARWSLKAGNAGWTLAENGFVNYMCWDPAMGFFGFKPFDLTWGVSTNIAITRQNIEAGLPAAREAVALARQANDRLMLDESESCLAAMEAAILCEDISRTIRSKAKDETAKKNIAAWLDQLDRCAHIVRSRVFDWADNMEAKKPKRTPQDRVNHTAVAMLRTCDALRLVTARYGIPDPRPASRITDLLEWTEKDFTTNAQAVFTADITDQVPPEGGSFQVCFDLAGIVLHPLRAVFVNPATGARRVVAVSPEPDNDRNCAWRVGWFECRVAIPPVPAGEKVQLAITMQASPSGGLLAKGATITGFIGLRRVWETGKSPWEN